jgi:cellulose synthase/poly-beta-1,6-N-acetylglucosamine synthase-like glycosyltransferase
MLSFIVPAYNEDFELPRGFAAIRAGAERSDREYEIIVVDAQRCPLGQIRAKGERARLQNPRFRSIVK